MLCHACGCLLPSHYHSKICKEIIRIECEKCPKIFTDMKSLNRHQKIHCEKYVFKCNYCARILSSKCNLVAHVKNVHEAAYEYKICKL